MDYLIAQTTVFLLLAALLGGLVGWLLRGLGRPAGTADPDAANPDAANLDAANLDAARARVAELERDTARTDGPSDEHPRPGV